MIADELPTFTCWRCGADCDTDWHDISMVGDAEPRVIQGITRCTNTRCRGHFDQSAHQPPSPQEIQRRADKVMERFWQRMWTP